MSGDIKRNAAGVPELTIEQIREAHTYAQQLLETGASDLDVPPLQLAAALANQCRGFGRAQALLGAIAGVIGAAVAGGVLPSAAEEDEDEDEEEGAAPDPRLN